MWAIPRMPPMRARMNPIISPPNPIRLMIEKTKIEYPEYDMLLRHYKEQNSEDDDEESKDTLDSADGGETSAKGPECDADCGDQEPP